jgi:hypothetical protein
MNGQQGKITFLSLIVFLIVVFAGFMAFKYIANSLEIKQIKKEVYDTLGTVRGRDIENADVLKIIDGVLQKRAVKLLEYDANVDKGRNIIHYSFKYEIVTDYLLFQHTETVEVVDDLANYG